MKTNKIIFGLLCLTLSMGFTLNTTKKWDISNSSRTLWVKLCSDIKTKTVTYNSASSSDTIAGGSKTFTQVLAAIITDYNSVNSSYLRLAAYPDDPTNPGTAASGDTTFTTSVASTRTITICTSSTSGSSAGEASLTITGNNITGCTINISSYNDDVGDLTHILTHELGHCVGLDHPQDTSHAIMSYSNDYSTLRLQADDRMGILYLYPKTGYTGTETNSYGLQCSRK